MPACIEIITLEGEHGIGKTTICNELRKQGYEVIDEGFMSNDDFSDYIMSFNGDCKCHTFALELEWVGRMFKRICMLCSKHRSGEHRLKGNVIFTDRTYITPVIYGALTSLGELGFLTICNDIAQTIEDEFNAVFKNVLIGRPDIDSIFDMIQKRIVKEPIRKELKENEYDFLIKVSCEYELRRKFFHHVINLSDYGVNTPEEEVEQILEQVNPFLLVGDD